MQKNNDVQPIVVTPKTMLFLTQIIKKGNVLEKVIVTGVNDGNYAVAYNMSTGEFFTNISREQLLKDYDFDFRDSTEDEKLELLLKIVENNAIPFMFVPNAGFVIINETIGNVSDYYYLGTRLGRFIAYCTNTIALYKMNGNIRGHEDYAKMFSISKVTTKIFDESGMSMIDTSQEYFAKYTEELTSFFSDLYESVLKNKPTPNIKNYIHQ